MEPPFPHPRRREVASRAAGGAESDMCRTSGARTSSGHRTQPCRAGLRSVAPPALWLCRGRFEIDALPRSTGICVLTRSNGNLRVVAPDSWWETSRLELVIGASERSAGGAEDLSPARQGWVRWPEEVR